MRLELCPQPLKVPSAVGFYSAREDVFVLRQCPSVPQLFLDKARHRNHPHLAAFVALAAEPDLRKVVFEVAPRKLPYLVVRTKKAAVSKKATKVKVLVELFYFFKHRNNARKRLVERGRCLSFFGFQSRAFKPSGFEGGAQDGRQLLPVVVVRGGRLKLA